MRCGFRSFLLKRRPVRRLGSRPGTRKANEIGFQARTSGPRKAEIRPKRGAAGTGQEKVCSLGRRNKG